MSLVSTIVSSSQIKVQLIIQSLCNMVHTMNKSKEKNVRQMIIVFSSSTPLRVCTRMILYCRIFLSYS
ncbi:hypothetical protein CR513_47865, partial [Mucuna pruriens]